MPIDTDETDPAVAPKPVIPMELEPGRDKARSIVPGLIVVMNGGVYKTLEAGTLRNRRGVDLTAAPYSVRWVHEVEPGVAIPATLHCPTATYKVTAIGDRLIVTIYFGEDTRPFEVKANTPGFALDTSDVRLVLGLQEHVYWKPLA